MVGILRTCESLGCTINSFLRDCGEESLPWWAEVALWRGYAYLFGPGGRERIGCEFASLKHTIAASVGAKTKPVDHVLFTFPDFQKQDTQNRARAAFWALRRIAVERKSDTAG